MAEKQEAAEEPTPEHDSGRRKLIRLAAAAGGAVALGAALPGSWQKPIAQIGAVPAHAATSPVASPAAPVGLWINVLAGKPLPAASLGVLSPSFPWTAIRPMRATIGSSIYGQFYFTDPLGEVTQASLNSGAAQVGVGVGPALAASLENLVPARNGFSTCTGAIEWLTLAGWSVTPAVVLPNINPDPASPGSGQLTFFFPTPACMLNGSFGDILFQVRVNGRYSQVATARLNMPF